MYVRVVLVVLIAVMLSAGPSWGMGDEDSSLVSAGAWFDAGLGVTSLGRAAAYFGGTMQTMQMKPFLVSFRA